MKKRNDGLTRAGSHWIFIRIGHYSSLPAVEAGRPRVDAALVALVALASARKEKLEREEI